jgi:hypothetical protein
LLVNDSSLDSKTFILFEKPAATPALAVLSNVWPSVRRRKWRENRSGLNAVALQRAEEGYRS